MEIEWEKKETGTCERFEDVPSGAEIVAVDDIPCIGTCEVCDKPILEDQAYFHDVEGVMWHGACDG